MADYTRTIKNSPTTGSVTLKEARTAAKKAASILSSGDRVVRGKNGKISTKTATGTVAGRTISHADGGKMESKDQGSVKGSRTGGKHK